MTAADYAETEPERGDIDARRGPLLLEFGGPGCGFCRRAQPLIAGALDTWQAGTCQAGVAALPHIKIADGPGRPLGRSFGVKLWPTLVFLFDGVERARVVRPLAQADIEAALARITAAAS